MKKTLLIVLLLFACGISYSQTVRQWVTVDSGGFTGNDLKHNLSFTKDGKFVAVIPSSMSNPVYDSTGSVSGCMLSSDSGMSFIRTLWYKQFYPPNDTNIAITNYHTAEIASEKLVIVLGEETYRKELQEIKHPFIQRSADFGKTWQKIFITKDTLNYYRPCISMLNDTFGVMISGRSITPNDTNPSALYKTYNGGETWIENPIFLIKNYYAGSIKCYSENDYIAVAAGKVYTTKDGGLNWKITNPPPISGGYSFTSENLWFVSGVNNNICFLFKTTDQGATWLKVNDSITVPDSPLGFKVDFYDELNGLGIDAVYGEIMRTTDGGKTWDYEVTPHICYGENFQNAQFISKERAIALSISRIYLYTGRQTLMPPSTSVLKDTTELLGYRISWFKIKGADKYKIQLSESRTNVLPTYTIDDYEKHLAVNDSNITDSIFDVSAKLRYNKRYHVRVKAYTDSTESDWSKMKYFDTPADTANYPPLDTCKIIEPNTSKVWPADKITFIWNKIKNAKNYTLSVCTPFTYATGFYEYYIENLSDTSYTLTKFYPDQQYLCWVIAQAQGWADSPRYFGVFFTEKLSDLHEYLGEGEITITPNPASDYIEIDIFNHTLKGVVEDHLEVGIFNILGERVLSDTPPYPLLIEGGLRLDVSGLPAGVYFVKIGDKFEKFIKS